MSDRKCEKCGETQGIWPDYSRNRRSKKYSHYTCYACGHKWKEPKFDWKKEVVP